MGFNIDSFKTEITGRGTLQTNKFEVFIPLPRVMGGSTATARMLALRAENVKFPGVNLDLTQVNRYGYGPRIRSPFNVNFNDNSITFIEDEVNTVSKFFYIWMNSIFDYSGVNTGSNVSPTYLVKYRIEYVTDIKIYVYNTAGFLASTVVMKDAYPTNLGDVGLGWSDNNSLFRVNVGFTFKEWYIEQFVQNGRDKLTASTGTYQPGTEKSPTNSNAVMPGGPDLTSMSDGRLDAYIQSLMNDIMVRGPSDSINYGGDTATGSTTGTNHGSATEIPVLGGRPPKGGTFQPIGELVLDPVTGQYSLR